MVCTKFQTVAFYGQKGMSSKRTSTMKWWGELWGDSFIDTLVVAAVGWLDGTPPSMSPSLRTMASLPQPTLLFVTRCKT
jgi:hypothetical protein